MITRFLIVCLCALMTACLGGPPPKQYLLEPVLDPVNETNPPSINAVALSVVMVPAYASDQRLASRDEDYKIVYSSEHKWADSPDEAITRVLANRLRVFLEANVIVEPWPRGYEPQARIEVQLDKLIRESSGGAEMSGQIRIIAGDGKSMIGVRTFQFVRYARTTNPDAYFNAVAAGVNDISRMVADSLSAHFNK